MSCFFDAIYHRLSPEWRQKVAGGGGSRGLPRFFADHNRATPEVLCNGMALSQQQQKENVTHVKELRGHNVSSGYLTCFYEPYFFLCCALFDVDIRFNYRGSMAVFSRAGDATGRKVWTFSANSGHIS